MDKNEFKKKPLKTIFKEKEKFFEDQEQLNKIISQEKRYDRAQNEFKSGFITNEEKNCEINRITSSILKTIDEPTSARSPILKRNNNAIIIGFAIGMVILFLWSHLNIHEIYEPTNRFHAKEFINWEADTLYKVNDTILIAYKGSKKNKLFHGFGECRRYEWNNTLQKFELSIKYIGEYNFGKENGNGKLIDLKRGGDYWDCTWRNGMKDGICIVYKSTKNELEECIFKKDHKIVCTRKK